jgi:hypothetical protein
MRARRSTQVGWGVAAWAALVVGCSGATDPGAGGPTPAQIGAPLAVTPGVPQEFPRMLGCAAEELGNPDDPVLRDQLKKLCDLAQAGLYALAQDTSLTPDEQRTHALMIMGGTLERMTQLLDEANPPTSPDATDAGIVP